MKVSTNHVGQLSDVHLDGPSSPGVASTSRNFYDEASGVSIPTSSDPPLNLQTFLQNQLTSQSQSEGLGLDQELMRDPQEKDLVDILKENFPTTSQDSNENYSKFKRSTSYKLKKLTSISKDQLLPQSRRPSAATTPSMTCSNLPCTSNPPSRRPSIFSRPSLRSLAHFKSYEVIEKSLTSKSSSGSLSGISNSLGEDYVWNDFQDYTMTSPPSYGSKSCAHLPMSPPPSSTSCGGFGRTSAATTVASEEEDGNGKERGRSRSSSRNLKNQISLIWSSQFTHINRDKPSEEEDDNEQTPRLPWGFEPPPPVPPVQNPSSSTSTSNDFVSSPSSIVNKSETFWPADLPGRRSSVPRCVLPPAQNLLPKKNKNKSEKDDKALSAFGISVNVEDQQPLSQREREGEMIEAWLRGIR